jgi:hypothetical protein
MNAMNLHIWVAIAGIFAVTFGLLHITRKTAPWFGDWASPYFEIRGGGAVAQGVVEVVLGAFLCAGSALDYLGLVSFRPVMNLVKAFLEF